MFITGDYTFDVLFTLDFKKGFLCSERFLIGNTEIAHLEDYRSEGTYKISFNLPSEDAKKDFDRNGVSIWQFCNGAKDELKSLLQTLHFFLPGGETVWDIDEKMEAANLDFLKVAMGIEMDVRPIQDIDIDESLVQSGDAFLLVRMDGTGPLIMYGTGGHLSHTTMALHFDDGLYIVESQGAEFWPTPGINRTPFNKWLEQVRKASYNVVWLPLKKEIAASFNESAARNFFAQTKGLPYGYHNFIFGWIDTPYRNMPPLMAQNMLPTVGMILENIAPGAAYVTFGAGLNKRMGTTGKSLSEIAALAADQDMSILDVMAMPDQEDWVYYDGSSYVCSAYVTAQYKRAGLFGDLEINATEFHPRDVYSLDFFDKDFVRPQACIDADPDLPYCQIAGKYRIEIPEKDYSTVSIYGNMNEHCETVWPDYIRGPSGC